MTGRASTSDAEIVDLDDSDEAFDVFDTVCRRELSISGSEFITRWNAGVYDGVETDSIDGLAEVLTALPFAADRGADLR